MKPIYWKNIPLELAFLIRWVVWKGDKVPRTPGSHRPASTTNPTTWRSLGQALASVRCGQADGIGFVFTDTPFAGIDLDHCLRNGKLTSQAARIVASLCSFTEISPSGSGLHIIVRGYLPPGARRKGDVEMYDTNRYFTVTGHVWRNLRIVQRRQAELARLHAHLFGRPSPRRRPRPSPLVAKSDQELLRKATSARNGAKFACLWEGDFSDYDSHSEADLALCNFLAFWTGGDAARIDALFRQSGLFRPKWDEKHYSNGQTYGQGTLKRTLAECTEYYQAIRSQKGGNTMSQDGVLTIELKLDLNWALVEWYTDGLLSDENMDIAAFTREEIAAAWTAAVQKKMEFWAEDADTFLDHNGAEERFWKVLLAEQAMPGGGRACHPSPSVV